jgi:hypothetical protein
VAGGVGEAADLAVLGDHVADRVVDQVDQPVRTAGAGAGHVAHPDLDVLAARLLAQAVDHVLGLLDAVDPDARLGQRQGDPAGADGELQRVPADGQAGQERDRLRLVAAGVGGVVTPGFLVAEAGPGVETVHLMRPLR